MNEQPSKIGDQIEGAMRMLHTARAEFRNDHVEDTIDFLRIVQRRVGCAIQGLEASGKVIALPREKTNAR